MFKPHRPIQKVLAKEGIDMRFLRHGKHYIYEISKEDRTARLVLDGTRDSNVRNIRNTLSRARRMLQE